MPPQVRTRATKAREENVDKENRRPKGIKKQKNVRKVLGDKTNSLSDDNESVVIPSTVPKKIHITTEKQIKNSDIKDDKQRPRRQRRLPNRYIENDVFIKAKPKKIDVYEFTFDPDEEPTPKKKKRKRVVKKKQETKKQFVYKNNYDKNVSKALAILKNVVSKKPTGSQANKVVNNKPLHNEQNKIPSTNKPVIQGNIKLTDPPKPSTSGTVNNYITEQNYSPIYEDNLEFDHGSIDLNYSPINTECQPKTPNNVAQIDTHEQVHKDPLNLQDDLSFFDDQPIASSSMNVSAKHPFASPWRVEFESLPIKWHVNSYVKPNMTPAVECSFISSEDNVKKQHVYTNMVPLNNDSLPQIVEKQPNYLQTSIASFIKEVAEKQARKKHHKSPRKLNSLFVDVTNTVNHEIHTPKKLEKNTFEDKNLGHKNTSNSSSDLSNDKENSKENRKRKNNDAIVSLPAKSPRREKNKDCTYFGFDDTEDNDENVSPVKNNKNRNVRSLRPRSRAVLNEINRQTGPTRPVVPLAAKSNVVLSSEAVNKVYEDLKSAADAPMFKEQNVNNRQTTNIDESQVVMNDNDESQSLHLFEDIDVVHHLKPVRKSYGKAKKVTFRPKSVSDSDTYSDNADKVEQESSEEDDLADLSFHIPEIVEKKTVKKKPTKKKLMSKKEEKEADAWAAGFNSMCEDIEEFPLLVE